MCKENEHEYIVGSLYEHNKVYIVNNSTGSKNTKYYKICTFICKKCGDIKETKLGIEDFKD